MANDGEEFDSYLALAREQVSKWGRTQIEPFVSLNPKNHAFGVLGFQSPDGRFSVHSDVFLKWAPSHWGSFLDRRLLWEKPYLELYHEIMASRGYGSEVGGSSLTVWDHLQTDPD